jgi:hypothetical protein
MFSAPGRRLSRGQRSAAPVAPIQDGFRPAPNNRQGSGSGKRRKSIRHAPTKAAPTPTACGGKPSLFHPCPAHPVEDYRGGQRSAALSAPSRNTPVFAAKWSRAIWSARALSFPPLRRRLFFGKTKKSGGRIPPQSGAPCGGVPHSHGKAVFPVRPAGAGLRPPTTNGPHSSVTPHSLR